MMIKICGITNREDAVAAVEAGASALGFNFYARSPRYVSPDMAAAIGADLPVLKVGVFVNESDAVTIASRARLDILQFHGDESPADIPAGVRAWKAFRVTPGWSASGLPTYGVEAILLDGPLPGSGEAFDWTQAIGSNSCLAPVILAGGLGPDNVSDAIRRVHPWGVDACSRLERTPGKKDHAKMRDFIEAAMQAAMERL